MFDLRADAGFKCLLKCDVRKELCRWQRLDSVEGSCDTGGVGGVSILSMTQPDHTDLAPSPTVEAGAAIVGLCYLPLRTADISIRSVPPIPL